MEGAAARRMRLLEELRDGRGGRTLAEFARQLGVDERTVRRDVDCLAGLLGTVRGVEVRRGVVHASRAGFGHGYLAHEVEHERCAKEAIARRVLARLQDNQAVALTAGSTTWFVARAMRRAAVEQERPHGLIVFTNSLPALGELIAAGIPTGVLGEVYDPDDCAFHSHELRSAFHPSVGVVGASGVVANPTAGTLDLFCHRAEEAAFLKQLLGPVPEVVVAADATKIGRRHPWSFTGGGILAGKAVHLVTTALAASQREALELLAACAPKSGTRFTFEEA